jgi:hypothetical protein
MEIVLYVTVNRNGISTADQYIIGGFRDQEGPSRSNGALEIRGDLLVVLARGFAKTNQGYP